MQWSRLSALGFGRIPPEEPQADSSEPQLQAGREKSHLKFFDTLRALLSVSAWEPEHVGHDSLGLYKTIPPQDGLTMAIVKASAH